MGIITTVMSVGRKWRVIAVAVLLLGIAGILTAVFWNGKGAADSYITAKVERGTIEVKVSATGTVQAVTTVQVGSQVSGTVSWLGADFNSQVKRGQIVARLDPAVLQAQVDTANANVLNAQAAVQVAVTEVNNQKANLSAARANQDVARIQKVDAAALASRYEELKQVLSGRELEAAQAQANAASARHEQASAQVGQAQANGETAKARLEQAKADLSRSKAQLDQARVNLEHTIISSPIDGVVVSRNVDVGQTVAASLQAPTLFTIANDLTKMQVLASIDEADVGQIKEGIKATFSVDAFPGETFGGNISQIRLNAQTQQNVVTYTAVIDVSNPNLKLRPGMTTNITVMIAQRDNVLTVPNAALRFKPNLSEKEQQELREQMQARRAEREAQRGESGGQGENQGRRQDQDQRQQGGTQDENSGGQPPDGDQSQRRQGQTVWILLESGKIEPRFVRPGLTNGRLTEVAGGNLNEGDTVIIGQEANGRTNRTSQPQGGSPFNQRPPGMGPGMGPRGR